MMPALTAGGVLLWRRTAWGYVIATIASMQGALYLLVLSASSIVSIRRGFVAAPGELPIWGTLLVVTAALAGSLLGGVRRRWAGSPSPPVTAARSESAPYLGRRARTTRPPRAARYGVG